MTEEGEFKRVGGSTFCRGEHDLVQTDVGDGSLEEPAVECTRCDYRRYQVPAVSEQTDEGSTHPTLEDYR